VKIHRDKSISEETFVLEDHVFIDCTLKNCDLFYSGGDVEFVNLKLDNCRFHFRGAAKNTQMLMFGFGMLRPPSEVPLQVSTSTQKPN
jgi:hypothetical protein